MESQARTGVEDVSEGKPMTSQIYWAMLGLVIERPSHGYELAQRFERAYGHVLSLSNTTHGYTALGELERRGFIEQATGAPATRSGTPRQSKVPYRATEEGRRSYRERMLKQAGEDRRQLQLFVLQLAAFEHEPAVALEILDHYETACLREARQMPRKPERLADRLLAGESRMALEGRMPWVEVARDEFNALGTGGGNDAA
jgi:DNA-binding PadR family transcriptional regulator